MTKRSVTHATFVIERTYDAPPAKVFAALAEVEAKRRWYVGPEDAGGVSHFEMDFRVGGRETNRGGPKGGRTYTFDAIYRDIVPDERIVYVYDMYMGDTRISVSLATVQLAPAGKGTRLTFTEQGAYLDGHDVPSVREGGMRELFDALAREVEG